MKNTITIIFHVLLSFGFSVAMTACSDTSDSYQNSAPAPAPDSYGPFGVGHGSFTAIDPLRGNRMLAVELWYPVDEEDRQASPLTSYALGPGIGLESEVAVDDLPVTKREKQSLLVFSHGYGGINTASSVLMETLASHGFIVIAPEHTGNSQASNDDTFDQAAANRVPDVSFLIDTMINRSRDSDDILYDRIDEQSIGVVGHSFGGMTAVGMAAGWAGAEPDPRVKAIVPISAVFDAELQSDERTGANAGFTADQLARISVPVMLMGGSMDVNVFPENNRIAFDQIVSAPIVYRVDIVGANHTHFANICDIGNLLISLGIPQDNWSAIGAADLLEPYATTCGPEVFPIEEVVRLQNVYVVSFFKRHLLADRRYDAFLNSDYASREPSITFSVREPSI